MNGWILLHKKIWDNPRFYKNPNALAVWIWLLTHCNQNGVVTCGSNQIAEMLQVSQSTAYRILSSFSKNYLNNEPLVTIKVTNRFSIVTILKWAEMQQPKNNKKTSKRITSAYPVHNERILINNKEERIKKTITNVIEPKAQFGNNDVNTVIEKFETTYKLKLSKVKQNRNAASNLIRKHGLDQTLKAIEAASMCLQDQYAPSIVNLMDLQEKYDKLRVYYARQTKQMEMINADN